MKEYRKIFAALDDNHSGSINAAEFKRALNKMKLTPSDEEVKRMIGLIDRPSGNGCPPNGKIEFAEWRNFMLLAGETSSFTDFRCCFASSYCVIDSYRIYCVVLQPVGRRVVISHAKGFHFRDEIAQKQRQVQRRSAFAFLSTVNRWCVASDHWFLGRRGQRDLADGRVAV